MGRKNYKDILSLPHHQSLTRQPMPLQNRAAQFAPFAALTGYEQVIFETARQTETQAELAEDQKAELNERLCQLAECLDSNLQVNIEYFVPDNQKTGGAYHLATGAVQRIDTNTGTLTMKNGTVIPFAMLKRLTGPIWDDCV